MYQQRPLAASHAGILPGLQASPSAPHRLTWDGVDAGEPAGAFARPLAYVGDDKTCFQVVAPEAKKYLKTVKFLGCVTRPR